MAKKIKLLSLQDIYPHVEALSIPQQQALIGFIEKMLADKKEKAEKEAAEQLKSEQSGKSVDADKDDKKKKKKTN